MGENGVSSIFGPITTLFNYFNKSKIELTPFSDPIFFIKKKFALFYFLK
jgi:hypothetical protein